MTKIPGKFHVEAITISNDNDKIKSFESLINIIKYWMSDLNTNHTTSEIEY